MSGVERVNGWRTTDGQVFATEGLAQAHQDKLDFIEWCLAVIGPATGGAIAEKIWRSWHISLRRTEVPQED